jgi:hypothetical protein
VDAGVLQTIDPRLHQIAVVVEQRGLVERAFLVGDRRHPIGAVLGEQPHPVAEAPLVEEARLVDHERLELSTIDSPWKTGVNALIGRAWRRHHAASRM